MKEIIICSDKIEFLRLLEIDQGNFKLKFESGDTRKTIPLDGEKLKTMQGILNQMYPLPVAPNVAPASNEPVRVIPDDGSVISLEQLAKYLRFESIQEMIQSLPDGIRITRVGSNVEKAVIKVDELTKKDVTIDLKTLKTPQLDSNKV